MEFKIARETSLDTNTSPSVGTNVVTQCVLQVLFKMSAFIRCKLFFMVWVQGYWYSHYNSAQAGVCVGVFVWKKRVREGVPDRTPVVHINSCQWCSVLMSVSSAITAWAELRLQVIGYLILTKMKHTSVYITHTYCACIHIHLCACKPGLTVLSLGADSQALALSSLRFPPSASMFVCASVRLILLERLLSSHPL